MSSGGQNIRGLMILKVAFTEQLLRATPSMRHVAPVISLNPDNKRVRQSVYPSVRDEETSQKEIKSFSSRLNTVCVSKVLNKSKT